MYCYGDQIRPRAAGGSVVDLGQLRELFKDFAEPVPSLLARLTSLDSVHYAPIEEVWVDPCAQGRVVLIGDAAHATSPNMAQGAAMAIEDAIVLSDMLAGGGPAIEALAAFAARRRARVRWVQRRTHRRDRI